MKYFWLTPKDVRVNLNVFRSTAADECLRLLPKFRMLDCSACGKIDEFAAVRLGIKSLGKSRSKIDFQASGEDLILVSDRFITVCREADLSGVEFLPFCPAPDGQLWVMLPLEYATVDVDRSGYRGTSRCLGCQRWSEHVGFPKLESMTLEGDESVIRHPNVFNESCRGKRFWFFVSEPTKECLKSAKLTGLSFKPVA